MKIGQFANVIPFPEATRAKRSEGEGGHARQQYGSQEDRKEEKREKPEPFDPQRIDDAVQSFHSDTTAREHGLSATVEGSGPGLKIHVKDCNGTTLRQFSGEEFLRLREATSQSRDKRGKILDQKL